jgi:TATA-box binding protein (TBP) (component of TFIID and TFIIIB)
MAEFVLFPLRLLLVVLLAFAGGLAVLAGAKSAADEMAALVAAKPVWVDPEVDLPEAVFLVAA